MTRLTDAQALAHFDKRTRDFIKSHGFVRCLNHPNRWHDPEPRPSIYPEVQAQRCRCRSAVPS